MILRYKRYYTMDKFEYLFKAINAGLPLKLNWIRLAFSIPVTDNDFIIIKDDVYYVKLDDEFIKIKDSDISKPLFNIYDKIIVDNSIMSCITKKTETTVGRLILNYIVIYHGLNCKIPFINKMFTYSDIESKYILPNLKNDSDVKTDSDISISEYKKLGGIMAYLRQVSNAIVVVSTEKTFYPPDGFYKKKEELLIYYKKKYGDNFANNPIYVLEFEDELMGWVKDAIKDDPTYGITMSGKVLNTSFKKKYVSLGIATKMDENEDSVNILSSLYDSYPNDKKAIATIFNGIRYGSYARGNETKDSGLIAKMLIRATHGFKIDVDDCGTTDAFDMVITKDSIDSLVGVYIKDKNKFEPKPKEWLLMNIGKRVSIRNPLYCKAKGEHFCKVCVGDTMAEHENGIGLLSIGLGGEGLSLSLSKFHSKDFKLDKLKFDEFIR